MIYPDHFWLTLFLAGRRAGVLGAGAFFFSASMLARRASMRLTTCGAGPSFAGSIFSPASFFFAATMPVSLSWDGSPSTPQLSCGCCGMAAETS
jgi:hypothetical protein